MELFSTGIISHMGTSMTRTRSETRSSKCAIQKKKKKKELLLLELDTPYLPKLASGLEQFNEAMVAVGGKGGLGEIF